MPTRTPRASAVLDFRPFWEAQHQNRLFIPRCPVCATWHFSPRKACLSCVVGTMEWAEVSGKGTVHSLMIGHPEAIALNAEPGIIAVVDLEEGARVMAELVGIEPDAPSLKVGMPVTTAFVYESEDSGGVGMPLKLRPA